jgi:hypothetical protein
MECHRSRITASGIHAAMGESIFKTREQYAQSLCEGGDNFSLLARIRMSNGTVRENKVREWYEAKNGVRVEEISMGIPEWDPYYGASPDGKIVGQQAGIEIKNTDDLDKYLNHWSFKKRGGIFPSHYYQVQLNLLVFDWDYIDYVVHDYNKGEYFVNRILADEAEQRRMMELANEFKEQLLLPRIRENPRLAPTMPV